MQIYLWSAGANSETSRAIEHRMRAAISDLITISDIDDVLFRGSKRLNEPVFVTVFVPSNDRRLFVHLTELAERHQDWLFLILIGDDISIDDYKRLARTGGAEWVSTNAGPQEILDIISRRQTRLANARPERSPARSVAISFIPSAGGVGNTTLAVEAGIYLKTTKTTRAHSVCLIDLDFQCSNGCDYLDIEPRLQIQEISTNPERLDAQLFDIFVSHHISGLDVFAAPRTKFDYCNLAVSALDNLFTIAASRYDLILVDLPVTWFQWTSNVIAASDAALVVGLNTVPGLRQIAETLAAVRAIPNAPERVVVAVNRCQRRLVGRIARRQHVETALPSEQVLYVGEEPGAIESINVGTPMALKNSYRSIGKDIAALADFCASVTSGRGAQS
jgi:pilus assembly protein CpaE